MSLAATSAQKTQAQNQMQIREIRKFVMGMVITGILIFIASIYLRPLYFSLNSSLGKGSTESDQPQYPASVKQFTFNGLPLEMYNVPTADGLKQLAMIEKGRASTVFLDPESKQRITWEGSWRSLKRVYYPDPRWSNYPEASK